MNRASPNPAFFDPTWLFLVAGVALLAATVLVAAQDDVDEANHLRDQVLAVEQHRETRLNNYREFLAAIDEKQPALVQSLASSQLNQIPADRAAIPGTVQDNSVNASVFPALEPPPVVLPVQTKVDSTLRRLATTDATRIWLLAGGALCILLGLLPASRKPGEVVPA
ncbi:hypothetical protein LBMAG48_06440 [Phycisphaerae bacterium]|nr:hypothetical protein LBMAG48_06440 [Phycisphaerae bacterium]